ncbi:MBG domain-containing protein [Neorhizobium petrolearium]|uniref:MBG domain-containing protein n=1 Tax=Neorhizobium petrolearium TaxID=515361 RepID=UPI003F7D8550
MGWRPPGAGIMIPFCFAGLKAQLLSTTGLALALAAGAGLLRPALADPLPTGASVAAGQVSVGSAGKSMTITQGSQNAIVNWNSFSVGQGHTVNFAQPGSSSAILNRVTGSTTSTIAGSLTGNGHVYLINPNGIAITKTGNVKVGGGFVASTLDTSDEEFLKGKRTFAGKGTSAAVENSGVITIGPGGYAALIGGRVSNDGLISVPMGKVGLGSGEEATLDLSGDGFLQVAVPTKASGADALVKNGGRISADGGRVVISAATAREAARNAINLPGTVEARTISGRQGEIVIGGGAGGSVSVSGRLNVTASGGGKGGKVKITGKSVKLNGAVVDASGAAGGGTVEVGGNRQGKGPLQRAETTAVDRKSVIRADATEGGAGGDVVIWSDEMTVFDGLITARGTGLGSGGEVEVSGKAKLDFTGAVDLTAENGRFGNLLLDPYNVTIALRPSSNSNGMTPTGNDSVIDVLTLQNALATANVTIATGGSGSPGSQAGDITVAVAGNLFWSSDSILTLSAYGDIHIDSPIVATGANAGLVLNYGDFATSGSASTGSDYFVHRPVTLSGANAGLTINGQAYTIIRSAEQLQAMNGNLGGNYALAGTLDLEPAMTWNDETGMVPIGDYADPFTGTFTGMGNSIEWLLLMKPDREAAGLFGVSSGTIRDVNLYLGIASGAKYVGSLVGVNSGIVKNASSRGVFGGGSLYSGGLVGLNTGTIYGSYTEAMLSNTQTGFGNGGLVGRNDGTIEKSHAEITISGRTSIGGLVGENNGTITSSYAGSSVSGVISVGGLAGTNNGTITNSYATGATNGANNVGGLVGDNKGAISSAYATGGVGVGGGTGVAAAGGLIGSNSGQVHDVYATGNVGASQDLGGDIMNDPIPDVLMPIFGDNVHGSYPQNTDLRGIQKVGGLVGFNSGVVTDAYATGDVTGTVTGFQGVIYQFVGGLIGENGGAISNVFATGDVDTNTGGADGGQMGYGTGGLVGLNITSTSDVEATISNAYATGNVNGGYGTGGLVGVNGTGGAVSSSYATGDVTGFSLIGGLVGLNQDATVRGSYSTGAVSGQLDLGGLVGNNLGTVVGSFWNTTSSGLTNGFGKGTIAGAAGLDDAQMMQLASFETAGWDIEDAGGTGSVWRIYDGYTSPLLRSFLTPVTVKANDASKVYDGTDQGGESGYSVSVDGAELFGTASYAGSGRNVGSHELTVSGLYSSQQGSDISYASGTLTITPRAITVIVGDTSRTYGDANPALGYTVGGAGLVEGDTLSGVLSTAATTSSGVGSYAIGQGNLAASSNYDVTFQEGTLTVTPRAITVRAHAANRIYGDDNPVFSYSVGGQGLVNGDSLGGTLSTDATARSNVGSYAIGQGSLAASSNYALAYVGGTLAIVPRSITVTANDLTRDYGDGNPAFTYTAGGLLDGDMLSGALSTTATGASGVGSYMISKGTLDNRNYDISFTPGTLAITPRAITVVAGDTSRTYGDANPVLGYVVGGKSLVNGDTLSGALSTAASAASGVGSYTIDKGSLAASSNYDVTYQGGTLTIIPRAITVIAGNMSRTYGDNNPVLDYTVSGEGLVNGDMLSGALSTAATATSGVGSYAIGQGSLAASSNYNVTYQGGTLTVTPRAITVTASGASRIYGNENPAFAYSIGGQGLVNGDSLSGMLATEATAQSDAGSYLITQGTLDNDNYAISYQGNVLTVLPREITVTADDIVRRGGSANPALTYSIGGHGLANGDVLTGSLATAAGIGSVAGRYDIMQGSLSSSANYAMTFRPGTLTVVEQGSATLPPVTRGPTIQSPAGIVEQFIRQQQALSGIMDGTDDNALEKPTSKPSVQSSGISGGRNGDSGNSTLEEELNDLL